MLINKVFFSGCSGEEVVLYGEEEKNVKSSLKFKTSNTDKKRKKGQYICGIAKIILYITTSIKKFLRVAFKRCQ